jgi:hypothetical protein
MILGLCWEVRVWVLSSWCAPQQLFSKHCGVIPGSAEEKRLTVGELNAKLDELAASDDQVPASV